MIPKSTFKRQTRTQRNFWIKFLNKYKTNKKVTPHGTFKMLATSSSPQRKVTRINTRPFTLPNIM